MIVPRKSSSTVARKLDVIRWVGIDEVITLDRQTFQIAITERPADEQITNGAKIRHVVDRFVFAKRNIEFAAAVEPAADEIDEAKFLKDAAAKLKTMSGDADAQKLAKQLEDLASDYEY